MTSQIQNKNFMYGHRRRPSIGKELPISAIIIDYNNRKSYDKIASDGLSPEIIIEHHGENQYFGINNQNNNNDNEDNLDGNSSDNSSGDDKAISELDEDETYELKQNFNIHEFRQKLAVAEALAKASMLTSPAVKRRLAARKVEMELDQSPQFIDDDGNDYVPPRELLIYLVRMGSFNSAPKINNSDTQDDDIDVPNGLNPVDLLRHCQLMRGDNRPQLLIRKFLKPSNGLISNDITDGMRVLKLDAVSKVCSPITSPKHIRFLQWNILSQTLGQNNDGFVCCPDEALTWECRKYQIVQEIIQNDPDIVCLQEVDHFKFLQNILGTQNYEGVFFPKPDSPCLYIKENNGPDGCAIFYKKSKFEMINYATRVLEVWRVQSNQVAIAANLRVIATGKELTIGTTHLKARSGALLSKLRNEQGKDLLLFINSVAENRPIILSGDFNAEPIEPVYSTIINNKTLKLSSAYSDLSLSDKMKEMKIFQTTTETNNTLNNSDSTNSINSKLMVDQDGSSNNKKLVKTIADTSAAKEPLYTTWKIREDGEVCHTLDYIFYSRESIKVNNCLMFPDATELGKDRAPSFSYPSDHFSLLCDFELNDD